MESIPERRPTQKDRVAHWIKGRGALAVKVLQEVGRYTEERDKIIASLQASAPQEVHVFLELTKALESLFHFGSFIQRIDKEVYSAYGFEDAADAKEKFEALARIWEGDVLICTDYSEVSGATMVTMTPCQEPSAE